MSLDLLELSLLSIEGSRLLIVCEFEGVAVTNASPFLSVWIARDSETSERR